MVQGPRTLAFRASQTFAYREREPTERVNTVRELRKESFEERVERAGEERERERERERRQKER